MKPWTLAHKLVDATNAEYRRQGKALVSFAGPSLVDCRPLGKGRFSGILQAGPVDYIGHTSYTNRGSEGFRFDLKTCQHKTALQLSEQQLKPHQLEELLWCHEHEVASGLLAAKISARGVITFEWFFVSTTALIGWNIQGCRDKEEQPRKSIPWKELDGYKTKTMETCQGPDYLDDLLEGC